MRLRRTASGTKTAFSEGKQLLANVACSSCSKEPIGNSDFIYGAFQEFIARSIKDKAAPINEKTLAKTGTLLMPRPRDYVSLKVPLASARKRHAVKISPFSPTKLLG